MKFIQVILDTIENNEYKGYTIEEFSTFLHINDSDDKEELDKALLFLTDEGTLLIDDQKRYVNLETLHCIKGTLRVNPKGFGFVETEDTSVYVPRDEIKKALDKDEVIAKVKNNADGTKECKIVKIVKHSKSTIVGVIKKKESRVWFLPDTDIPDRKFKITNANDYALVNDTKVQVYIDKYGKTLHCSIIKVLGHKYDPGMDILSILLEHDIEPAFPKQVIREVEKIKQTIQKSELEDRLDLRDTLIVTIDGDDSKDLDDAIHVKKIEGGYQLGVHIADVSHYVRANTALDKEAYERATSVYVCDRVVPMLPQVLSNGICSLNPREDRLTISCIMDMDMNGNITDYTIAPSVINTCERLTYKNVNKIIDRDLKMSQKYEYILPMIRCMEELSLIIRKKRHDSGNIDFDTKESKILCDSKGRVKAIVLRERGESERIIEDFMISANECVAAHVKNMDLPSIYRVHETPELKKIQDFVAVANTLGYQLKGDLTNVYPRQLQQMLEKAKGDDSYSVLSTYMLRSMRKARYDVNCLGHFGLALQEYTHFTSPIRRYPDLIVHRMLRKYYFNDVQKVSAIEKDVEWIEKASEHTSEKERNAVNAERDVADMKKCEYMEKYIGTTYDGVISSVTKFGIFVELENTVEGLVHISEMKDDYYHYEENSRSLIGEKAKNKLSMGMKIRVQVKAASRFTKQIDFTIVK